MTRTLRALIAYGAERFERANLSYGHGTTNAADEAAWLATGALGLPPRDYAAILDKPITEAQHAAAKKLLDARVRTRKPAAYLLHEAWIGPHRFYVDERVIVPRSFLGEKGVREKLVSDTNFQSGRSARKMVSDTNFSPFSVLDLCTGSGCLAILYALDHPRATVDAVDLSDDALAVARRNVEDYGLAERVRLVKSDLFGALKGRKYDLIVSNPPYVTAASMARLPDEFRKEPGMALASGRDGLAHTKRILAEAREHLNPKGTLAVEIGHNRKALERAYPELPFRWPRASAGAGFVFVLPREAL